MLRALRLPTLACAFACASLACSSAVTEESPSASPPPSTDPSTLDAVVVENRTNAPIDLGVRERDDLTLDRSVVEGSVLVPMGPAAFVEERREMLAPNGTTALSKAVVRVTDGASNRTPLRGGFLRIGQGPAVVAFGRGKVVVRSSVDGSPILEAEDPRKVTVLPVDRDMPACGAADIGTPIEGLPAPSTPLAKTAVVSVTVTDGCTGFRYVDAVTKKTGEVRACLPDGAYPFSTADALAIEAAPRENFDYGVRVTNEAGVALDLLLMRLPETQMPLRTLTLSHRMAPTCASIHPVCGDVMVPIALDVAMDTTVERDVPLGSALRGEREPSRTFYVLSAVGEPVGVTSCQGRSPHDVSGEGAGISIAIVERP